MESETKVKTEEEVIQYKFEERQDVLIQFITDLLGMKGRGITWNHISFISYYFEKMVFYVTEANTLEKVEYIWKQELKKDFPDNIIIFSESIVSAAAIQKFEDVWVRQTGKCIEYKPKENERSQWKEAFFSQIKVEEKSGNLDEEDIFHVFFTEHIKKKNIAMDWDDYTSHEGNTVVIDEKSNMLVFQKEVLKEAIERFNQNKGTLTMRKAKEIISSKNYLNDRGEKKIMRSGKQVSQYFFQVPLSFFDDGWLDDIKERYRKSDL